MTDVSRFPELAGRTCVLRITTAVSPHQTGEEIRVDRPVTIGRDPTCEVTLDDPSVSRRHARVEPDGDDLKVVDLGSGNGVWVGTERVSDARLPPGGRFRIGATVFEYAAAAPPDPVDVPDAPTIVSFAPAEMRPVAAAPSVAEDFVLQVVDATESGLVGKEFVLHGQSAIFGRAPDSTIVLTERDISRKHARLDRTPEGMRLTDLGSSYGVWIGTRKVKTDLIEPGTRFRLGGRLLIEYRTSAPAPGPTPAPLPEMDSDATRFFSPEAVAQALGSAGPPRSASPAAAAAPQPVASQPVAPRPVAAPAAIVDPGVNESDFSHSVVMPIPAHPLATTTRVEDEGDLLEVSGHKPFLIDDPDTVWYVVEGGILIFTVAVEKGEPIGPRTHFLGILPGQVFLGFDLRQYGVGSGFLAVAKQGTKLRKIPIARLRQMAANKAHAATIAALVDTWVIGLSRALVAGLETRRTGELPLRRGERLEIDRKSKATAAEGALWVEISSGGVVFNDMATPVFPRRSTLFPVTPYSWIQPISDEFGALVLKPAAAADLVGADDEGVWKGIEVFHQVLCECEFINKKLATVDEFIRLQQKAEHGQQAQEAAYSAIGSVMSSQGATPREFLETGDAEPVYRACKLVGAAIGIAVKEHPSAATEEGLTYEEQVAAIASISGFRTRVVALRDNWYREDNGPLLAQTVESKDPVALLPTGPASYDCVDVKTGTRTKVDSKVAASLSSFAHAFYRPFPEGALKVLDVVKFASQGLKADVRWVVALSVVVGMFGTVTPWITGRVFDSAIPQADRTGLVGFGVALFFSALATSAFRFTQGVATVRIQSRMAAMIQASVWDRILNLPVNFFRKFSAGDLSDRADGVGAIQELISGAGVAAILGSVSGLFFVAQMFGYNMSLALLAILLTAIYVGFNFGANYLQLTYQRVEIQLRGRISGLVLNLLTGVTKLRVCGAEYHAFRVWAEQFARQRKLTFTIGNIQNVAAVFSSVFPILSSIAIFNAMISVQEAATAGQPGLTTGDFIAFNAAFGMFLGAMQALGDASLSLLKVVPIYERLSPILSQAPEVDNSKAYPGKLKGEIELSHVFFRYDPDGPWIINDVSIKINAGEFVAFVGSSGGGKSTIMRLMLGFEQPTRGSVTYDGQDLNSLDIRLVRQQLGVVLQTSRVMPTEMYRNIIGVTSRTLEDAWEAAEKAGLAEDIRNMPMGMHTYVSEGGGTLSGGQRQRLMIARAIVNRPKILFLDEATSALDNRTQMIVTQTMDAMDSTRIVIAHRLSTVENANRICCLHGGQIAELGTYQELMDKDGLFASLAKRQMA
jgi:NHLM bacteriocin system ABC transporter ATP-binding protein